MIMVDFHGSFLLLKNKFMGFLKQLLIKSCFEKLRSVKKLLSDKPVFYENKKTLLYLYPVMIKT